MKNQYKRPIGVTLLALAFLWIGCTGGVFFPILLLSGTPSALWSNLLTQSLLTTHPWLIAVLNFTKYPCLVIWYLLYIAYAFIGFGLWKLRDHARKAVIVISALFLTIAFPATVIWVRPLSLALAIAASWLGGFGWVIWYLNRPGIRYAFETTILQRATPPLSPPPEKMSTKGKVLTGIAVVATLAVFICALLFAIESIFRQSEVYKITLAEAGHSTCVASRIGTPFTPSGMVSGSIEESDTTGSAHLEIPIRGMQGKAALTVSAEKTSGDWKINKLTLVQNGKEIQILPDASTCQ